MKTEETEGRRRGVTQHNSTVFESAPVPQEVKMENIIGGSCFTRLHPKSPPEIQARALLCWVTQALPFGLLSTTAPLLSVNNAKRR